MKIFLFIILILWLAKAAKDALFWVYLWQIKEYRIDRMRAHFELRSAKILFLNKIYFLKGALLLSSALLFVGLWQFFFQIIASLFYAGFGIKSIYAAYAKRIKEPIFTKKAILTLAVILTLVVAVTVYIFIKFSYPVFLVSILIIDILLPFVVAGTVGILKFPSEFFKNRTIRKAKEKRTLLKDVLVIGITGSYGKTSMKEFLAHILSGKLKVLKTTDNKNTEIGVAQAVLRDLNKNYDVFIVEMGAYKEGEIKKICDIVRPQIGILTGINEQHSSTFGSIEKTIKTKYELIESLPNQGLAVFNGENDYTRQLYEKTDTPKRMFGLKSFSVGEKPDIICEKIDLTKDGMRFDVRLEANKESFETHLSGKHNALNIAGATLVAYDLGMSLEKIKKEVKSLPVLQHALEIKSGIKGTTIIDDTYSANPDGVLAALDALDIMRGNQKIIVLYPLIELGKHSHDIHRKIALKINKVCDLCILTSSDFSRVIRKNAPNTDVLIIQNSKRIMEKLKKTLREDDIVLLENRVPNEIIEAIIIPK